MFKNLDKKFQVHGPKAEDLVRKGYPLTLPLPVSIFPLLRLGCLLALCVVGPYACKSRQGGGGGGSSPSPKSDPTPSPNPNPSPAQAPTPSPSSPKADAPSAFTLQPPASYTGAKNIVLSWGAASGAASYSAFLAPDPLCQNSLSRIDGVQGLSASLGGVAEGQYFACVFAVSSAGKTTPATGNAASLTVDRTAPVAPDAPAQSIYVSPDGTLPFSWAIPPDQGAAGIDHVALRIGTSPGAGDFFEQALGLATSYAASGGRHGVTYYASLKAVDRAGNSSPWSPASDGITAHLRVDSPAGSPVIMDDLTKAFATITATNLPNGELYLFWDYGVDAYGISSYQVSLYSSPGCGGSPTPLATLTPDLNSYSVTASRLGPGTFSFGLASVNGLGQSSVVCSGGVAVNILPPPPLASVTTTQVSASLAPGIVELRAALPANTAYARIEVRRAFGDSPPKSSCSDGTLVSSYTSPAAGSTLLIDDDTGRPGAIFSYRLCLYDSFGNFNSDSTVSAALASPHYLFASSSVYSAAELSQAPATQLTSSEFAAADAKCSALAAAHNFKGLWRAVLSSSDTSAADRLMVGGAVFNMTTSSSGLMAASKRGLFDGALLTAPKYTETASALASGELVWSGSDNHGVESGASCGGWTTVLGGSSAQGLASVGNPLLTSAWLDQSGSGAPTTVSCGGLYHLYCMGEQEGLAAQEGSRAGEITLRFQAPPRLGASNWSMVDFYRAEGGVAPGCSGAGTLLGLSVFDFSQPTVFTDYAPLGSDSTGTTLQSEGGVYSYSACVLAADGSLLASFAAAGVRSGAVQMAKLIFATSSSYPASLAPSAGGLAGADALCTAAAGAAGYPTITTSWQALASSSTQAAGGRLVSGLVGRHYNTAGSSVFDGKLDGSGLWSAISSPQPATLGPVAYSEKGENISALTLLSSRQVWTATATGGALSTQSSSPVCGGDWTSPVTTSLQTVYGDAGLSGGGMVSAGVGSCGGLRRLYCVEQ